jgi:hypothetical protein
MGSLISRLALLELKVSSWEETRHAEEVGQLELLAVLEKLGPTQRLRWSGARDQSQQEHHL